ncbi:inositol monophosphatase family protein [Phaeobacter sp.]|uniref:inositol monophosphatase family protein n=1 Tax=Phaeobacter sp. TaxID=1902409 RepID=UPI0025F4FB87|nr:inositol monophosphatase family protein [Phaeobacter sp.]
MDLVDLEQHAGRIAALAGDTAMSFFRQAFDVEFKSDQSPVTQADKAVEEQVRGYLAEHFPDHGIFGEEQGVSGGDRTQMWVLDPIDGTRSFLSGHPLFGFLLAHLTGGRADLGVISMPTLQEIYVGVPKDGVATLNGAEISTSDTTSLTDAIVYINEGDKIATEQPEVFQRLLKTGQTRRFGYDCYPHALLASGHVDLVIDYDLKPYDFLALAPVVEAAGGVITGWDNDPLTLDYAGGVVAAATPELHAAALALVASKG